ncbi:MAG: DUF418 domain-containing protein [Chloroflexi bacterium]|nr:DUF418 domain-containing protein [Chloroflexota bacterium]
MTSVEVISAAMVALASPHLGTDLAVALFGRNMIPPLPLYMLSAGSTAMIVVLLLVELSQHFGSSRWWRVLATTGQFALTLYVAHIVIGMGIIQTLGWIDSGQPLGLATLYSLAFYAGCITFVGLWHMKFQRGPFEALLRHITD